MFQGCKDNYVANAMPCPQSDRQFDEKFRQLDKVNE